MHWNFACPLFKQVGLACSCLPGRHLARLVTFSKASTILMAALYRIDSIKLNPSYARKNNQSIKALKMMTSTGLDTT